MPKGTKFSPQYFLGIDGGQTHTVTVVCDQNGRMLGNGHAGPSNHVQEPGGMERLQKALKESIEAAWQATGLHDQAGDLPVFAAACCGMTGGMKYVPELMRKIARVDRLRVEHDTVIAHAGALGGQPGVVVIAGTGSVAYGVDSAGRMARSGGWAYLMGDEGSAYDLGRQALMAAARMQDGRGPATCLLQDILDHFGLPDFWSVRQLVYSERFQRSDVARLSSLIFQAARGGDAAAMQIVDQAGKSLAEIAYAVLRQLAMNHSPAHVSAVGGVFQAGEAILEPFSRHLHDFAPLADISPPIYPPAIGAAMLALRLAGIRITERRSNELAASADRLVKSK